VLCHLLAHQLGVLRPLEQVELLQVLPGVTAGRQLEVTFEVRAGRLERFDDFRIDRNGDTSG